MMYDIVSWGAEVASLGQFRKFRDEAKVVIV